MFEKCYDALLCAFQDYIFAVNQIKMLELEILSMLVNTVIHEYNRPIQYASIMGKAIFKNIFEKRVKILELK